MTPEEIRAFRSHLGLSQQAFAVALGLSIRSVQKYESDREPDMRSLLLMLRLAQSNGASRYAHMIRDHIRTSLALNHGETITL